MKCSGENVKLRGIFHVVSCFPLHFMLFRENLDYFLNRVMHVLHPISTVQLWMSAYVIMFPCNYLLCTLEMHLFICIPLSVHQQNCITASLLLFCAFLLYIRVSPYSSPPTCSWALEPHWASSPWAPWASCRGWSPSRRRSPWQGNLQTMDWFRVRIIARI